MAAYDVIVAGLGGMGSAVLARCAARGARALGIERFARGHTLGASTGKTRIIRQAYFEDDAYVPLLLRAYELWRGAQRDGGEQLLDLCGLLMCGQPDGDVIAGSQRAARRFDLPVESLTASALRRRYPALRVRDGEIALFERDGGVVFPERAVRTQLALAERRGAELRFDTPLRAWHSEPDRVTVELADGQTVTASALVLALGPWSDREFAALGIPFEGQRNVQAWFTPTTAAYAAGAFPPFLVERADLPAPLYGFPDAGDGVKAAFHGYGSPARADTLQREADVATDLMPLAAALEAWMPGAGGPVRATKVCMYALTPDRHFVVDRHPSAPNVVVCGGFSGHGFKFTPVVGEICADLALTGTTGYDIAFLSARRFARV